MALGRVLDGVRTVFLHGRGWVGLVDEINEAVDAVLARCRATVLAKGGVGTNVPVSTNLARPFLPLEDVAHDISGRGDLVVPDRSLRLDTNAVHGGAAGQGDVDERGGVEVR